MARARWGCAVAAWRGRLWASGGWHRGRPTRSTECYDPATDTWETKRAELCARRTIQNEWAAAQGLKEAQFPTSVVTGRYHHAMLVLGGTLVAVGGLEAASCERYDAARDAWAPCGDAMDLPGVRDFACAVVAWPEEEEEQQEGGGGAGGGAGAGDGDDEAMADAAAAE